jgi:hypothetical protein
MKVKFHFWFPEGQNRFHISLYFYVLYWPFAYVPWPTLMTFWTNLH